MCRGYSGAANSSPHCRNSAGASRALTRHIRNLRGALSYSSALKTGRTAWQSPLRSFSGRRGHSHLVDFGSRSSRSRVSILIIGRLIGGRFYTTFIGHAIAPRSNRWLSGIEGSRRTSLRSCRTPHRLLLRWSRPHSLTVRSSYYRRGSMSRHRFGTGLSARSRYRACSDSPYWSGQSCTARITPSCRPSSRVKSN